MWWKGIVGGCMCLAAVSSRQSADTVSELDPVYIDRRTIPRLAESHYWTIRIPAEDTCIARTLFLMIVGVPIRLSPLGKMSVQL